MKRILFNKLADRLRANRLGIHPLPVYANSVNLEPLRWLARREERTFVVFDTETTSLIENNDAFGIIEFGFVRVRPNGEVRCGSTLINPGRPILPAATAVHGIRDCDLLKAPSFVESVPTIRRLFADAIVCGHYSDTFDIPGLVKECKRFDIEPIAITQSVDIAPQLNELDVDFDSKELWSVARDLDIHLTGVPHRALFDALLTGAVAAECLVRMGTERFIQRPCSPLQSAPLLRSGVTPKTARSMSYRREMLRKSLAAQVCVLLAEGSPAHPLTIELAAMFLNLTVKHHGVDPKRNELSITIIDAEKVSARIFAYRYIEMYALTDKAVRQRFASFFELNNGIAL